LSVEKISMPLHTIDEKYMRMALRLAEKARGSDELEPHDQRGGREYSEVISRV